MAESCGDIEERESKERERRDHIGGEEGGIAKNDLTPTHTVSNLDHLPSPTHANRMD